MSQNWKNKVGAFIAKKSNLPKVIVIYGPTACGKTSLSIEVAKYIGSEIISVDARQVYRHMDIGTGKVTTEEMRGVPHHMLDIIDPSEVFSVVDFRERVEKLEIWSTFLRTDKNSEMGVRGEGTVGTMMKTSESKSEASTEGVPLREALEIPLGYGLPLETFGTFGYKSTEIGVGKELETKPPYPTGIPPSQGGLIPILCGGTGLYIDSLIFERTYPTIEADWKLRDELEKFRLEHGNQALWDRLNTIDPDYAKTLHPNDRHYIIRGIEVFEKTGKSKAEIIDAPKLKYDTLFLTPYDRDRAKLYDRINSRVESMFKSGLIEEVGYIRDTFTSTCPGLATIGYKEVVDYLEGRISLEESIRLVQQHSRNYAKRQITWNKKYEY